jgi:hypothetical protein
MKDKRLLTNSERDIMLESILLGMTDVDVYTEQDSEALAGYQRLSDHYSQMSDFELYTTFYTLVQMGEL